jgi:hypothetical protein
MNFIAKCLIAAPVCAALAVPFGYARAEKPAVDDKATSRVENLVTRSIGIRDARGAQVHAADVEASTHPGDAATGAGHASAQALTDPELKVAPLDNYRLELDNCCGPEEK